MKKLILILGIVVGMTACQKEEIAEPASGTNQTNSGTSGTGNTGNTGNTGTFNATGQTLIFQGDFMDAVHPTSGKVKIYEDKEKKRSLVFEGFKTDAGPDLRIYLAEDKAVTNSVEITDMVKNGDVVHVLPNSVDLNKQKYVLIWCKKFAVLFGSAQLK